MQTGSRRESNYIKGFDGIRAIAVSIVIVGHANITGPLLRLDYPISFNLVTAPRGVDIFFVLSGFLITILLLDEQARYGRIDLRSFFIRRAFRLLPLYYLYCAAVVLFSLIVTTGFRWEGLPYLLLNIFNFVPRAYRTSINGHIWSLSIEWHFYLFWPVVFAALFVRSKFIPIFVLLVLLSLSTLALRIMPSAGDFIYLGWTIPAAIPIIVGALTAMLLGQQRSVPLLTLPIAGMLYAWPAVQSLPTTGGLIRSTGASLFVAWIYCNQGGRLVSFLEMAPLRFVGMISYGLYIWHVFFMGTGPTRSAGQVWPPSQLAGFVMTLIAAPLSYYYFERPIQALQKRFIVSSRPPAAD